MTKRIYTILVTLIVATLFNNGCCTATEGYECNLKPKPTKKVVKHIVIKKKTICCDKAKVDCPHKINVVKFVKGYCGDCKGCCEKEVGVPISVRANSNCDSKYNKACSNCNSN